ncbi:MAG: DUF2007 domain-containing protein [Flavobacteriales bacterium]|nr:DUF2007 domain-containing protein [Flavobacteriales bacterium]
MLVTIARYNYAHEVAVLEAEFIAAEIPYYLKNLNTALAQPFYSFAMGGIELQVNESDVEISMEIVKRYPPK